MPSKRRAIVWFRQDLRLHDNEALREALHLAYEVIPVYIFDERIFSGKTKFGFHKTGPFRLNFIIEAVRDLRQSLRRLGSDLIIRVGKPEEELYNLAQEVKSSWIFCNRERTTEEVFVQDRLEKKLWSVGQELRYSRGKMLYHTGDLPFPIQHTPDSFAQFRKEVERYVAIRIPFAPPGHAFNFLSVDLEPGDLPTLQDFGHQALKIDSRSESFFKGGETAAFKHLNYYLWESDSIRNYKKTRNNLSGLDFSTKLSPWLAQGCLSPKKLYAEIKRYETERGKNKSIDSLILSLMYRDFLRFMVKKHGAKVFLKTGMRDSENLHLKNNRPLLRQWINGQTGEPLVDALMRELKNTGYISSRGRQIVSSYLVNEMGVNWQMGADYFESILIDYDVCSNWANWNTFGKVGIDPKEYKVLNPQNEAQRFDPHGQYIKKWTKKNNTRPSAQRQAEGSYE